MTSDSEALSNLEDMRCHLLQELHYDDVPPEPLTQLSSPPLLPVCASAPPGEHPGPLQPLPPLLLPPDGSGSGVQAAAATALPSEPPALEPSAAGVPDPGPTSRLASPVPSSACRTLHNQTAASFVAAGGASSPVTARKGKGKKKAKADEVGPDNSDNLVKVGGTTFVPGEDDIFNRNRLVGNEAIIVGSVVALQRSNKTALDTLSVLLATVDDLKKAAKAAPSVPAPPSDPAFASLYREHVETRHAVNCLSATLGSFPPSLTVRDALLELKAAVANFDCPPPFPRLMEDHIVSPATMGSLPASSATFHPPSLPHHRRHLLTYLRASKDPYFDRV